MVIFRYEFIDECGSRTRDYEITGYSERQLAKKSDLTCLYMRVRMYVYV